jgi:AcrR family transcriptional regulator
VNRLDTSSPSGAKRKPVARRATGQRARDPVETRRRILEAAVEEFCDFGFHGARIDNIAKRAGANKRLIYAYVGSKEDVYLEVLEGAYRKIRSGERLLNLEQQSAVEGMRTLARFTFQHFQQNPEFIRLLVGENLNEARYLKKLPSIHEMHSPLIGQIRNLLKRGEESGEFRTGVDPVQLYISIAALGFFYLSNRYTLSTIFDMDLMSTERLLAREEHLVGFVIGYLAAPVSAAAPLPTRPRKIAGRK